MAAGLEGGWGLGGLWAADVGALWLGELSAMEPGFALVVLSGSGWRVWPMPRMEDRAMGEVVCSECGVGVGEAARPRWPLWLRWLPWLAVAAVVVVAVGWGVMGERRAFSASVGEGWPGFVLPDCPPERVQRAASDPSEAMLLRQEAIAVADHFGWMFEPGAVLLYDWQVPEASIAPWGYGWPSTWISLRDPRSWPPDGSGVVRSGTSIGFIAASSKYVIELSAVGFLITLAVIFGWCCGAALDGVFRLYGFGSRKRAIAWIGRAAALGVLFMMMLGTPTAWSPPELAAIDIRTWQGTSLDIQLEQFREGDEREGATLLAKAISGGGARSQALPAADPVSGRLALMWSNRAQGTISSTLIGDDPVVWQSGTARCDAPSAGSPTTRWAWPEWRQEWLIVHFGTVGFPSSSMFFAVEPASLGPWCLLGLLAFWIAAGVRGLVQRRVIRRRELAGRCLTCGYAMGGGSNRSGQ